MMSDVKTLTRDTDVAKALEISRAKVAALMAPRNVVILGASDRPGSWAARLHRNLKRYGFEGAIYPINPKRSEIWDIPCYPDFASLPEPPDHVAIIIPASEVAASIRAAGAAGARSATIYTSGFEESHDEAAHRLAADLKAAITETGIAVSGTNCFGNVAAKSKLVTFMEDRQLALRPGPIGLVGQSGGVMMFTNRVLEERGLYASTIVTSGNETGLGLTDYIAFLAHEPEIKVIVCYTEAIRDMESFKSACKIAQAAGKPIVMMKLGQSDAGQEAAMAHTGALAGKVEVFDAIAGALGVIRVDSLDEAVEAAEFLTHNAVPKGRRLAVMTLSGAFRGIMLDAAAKAKLTFPPLSDETRKTLEGLLGVGSIVGNPLDGGFAVVSNADNYLACITAMDADPNTDILLLQEELPREPGVPRTEKYIAITETYAKTKAKKPIAFVSMLTHSHSDYSRKLRESAPHVAFLQEANKALGVIEKIVRSAQLQTLSASAPSAPSRPLGENARSLRAAAQTATKATALNEARSKALLAEYGFTMPKERLVTSAEAAVAAAREIGFPVVLKAVSAALLHKSDAGGVLLGLSSAEAVAAGWTRVTENVKAHGLQTPLEGMLVCQQISGGLELVLGLHRDPEMGLVAMVGSGGVLLELVNDVAFAAPPISSAKAADMLAQTRISKLLAGYRGSATFDEAAVISALMALGRIAEDLGDMIESVDINPLVALKDGNGTAVLDALFVLRPGAA